MGAYEQCQTCGIVVADPGSHIPPLPGPKFSGANADRIAAQIMERVENGGTSHYFTKSDAMDIAELLGRQDVSDALFRWFSTKGD